MDHSIRIEFFKAEEETCVLPTFDSDVAWELGTIIRTHCRQKHTCPAVIYIAHANSSQLLFFATSRSGTSPNDMHWAKRKEAVVLRWGASSKRMRRQALHLMNPSIDVQEAIKIKYKTADPSTYAFHAGGFPVRVRNVEGIVGVIVVSGLNGEDDHSVIVNGIQEYLAKGRSESDAVPQRSESMVSTNI